MGMEVRDGRSVFHSLSSHVAFPLRNKWKEWGCRVNCVKYDDHLGQVRLFDKNDDVIAHVGLKNVTRRDWLLGELYGKNLHSSMNVNQYKKYALLAKGVVFTAEGDGLTGVFANWLAMDSPVEHILDQGGRDIHRNRSGACCRAAFQRRRRGR